MRDPRPIKRLVEILGGNYYEYPHKRLRGNNHHWRLAGREKVIAALEALLPYLVVKDGEAKVAIRYCELPLSRAPEVKANRERLVIEIKEVREWRALT